MVAGTLGANKISGREACAPSQGLRGLQGQQGRHGRKSRGVLSLLSLRSLLSLLSLDSGALPPITAPILPRRYIQSLDGNAPPRGDPNRLPRRPILGGQSID